ncbi:MAG: hypothetical protein USCAAHI_01534 [Beijerinckiaceae bacterium]|nr:MAG: hypothetical protein USCAAHI_01534 [Beijerinckiaceae bacterium]
MAPGDEKKLVRGNVACLARTPDDIAARCRGLAMRNQGTAGLTEDFAIHFRHPGTFLTLPLSLNKTPSCSKAMRIM